MFVKPDISNYISISIRNSKYFGELDGSFYGFTYCSIIDYKPQKGINSIIIEAPAVDEAFFMKFYINKEYAQISKDTIIWKGKSFIKQTNIPSKNNIECVQIPDMQNFKTNKKKKQ